MMAVLSDARRCGVECRWRRRLPFAGVLQSMVEETARWREGVGCGDRAC